MINTIFGVMTMGMIAVIAIPTIYRHRRNLATARVLRRHLGSIKITNQRFGDMTIDNLGFDELVEIARDVREQLAGGEPRKGRGLRLAYNDVVLLDNFGK